MKASKDMIHTPITLYLIMGSSMKLFHIFKGEYGKEKDKNKRKNTDKPNISHKNTPPVVTYFLQKE